MRAKLKLLRGSAKGKVIDIAKPKFLIGRHDSCHLRPKHDGISRRHCELVLHEDRVTVQDLGSRNGTYVNGERASSAITLKTGDELRMGPLKFEVVVTDDAGNIMAPPGPVPEEHVVGDAASDSGLISQWLEEEPRQKSTNSPETRQFQLDDTEMDLSDSNAGAKADTETKTLFGLGKKKEKKKIGKLPTQARGAETANSREAAAETLKKLFNRGGS